MYAYIFDSFLQDRKYAHDITQIENRLVTLGIQGRTEKMTILKNIQEAVRAAIKRGATTIVVVGNDETVNKVLPQLVEEKITLGFIPLGPNQSIAQVLGIPEGLAACDVISRRVVRHLDMGRVNTMYFLFSLSAPANVIFDCGDYTVSSLDPAGSFTIHNFASPHTHGRPDDGQVELVVQGGQEQRSWLGRKHNSAPSTFSLQQAKITSLNGSAMITLDGQLSVKTPATLEVVKGKLDVIIGKNLK